MRSAGKAGCTLGIESNLAAHMGRRGGAATGPLGPAVAESLMTEESFREYEQDMHLASLEW